jgi:hypothetical protein
VETKGHAHVTPRPWRGCDGSHTAVLRVPIYRALAAGGFCRLQVGYLELAKSGWGPQCRDVVAHPLHLLWPLVPDMRQ